MPEVMIGIIGGTGLGEAFSIQTQGEQRLVQTPFGSPSGPITMSEWAGVRIALLARHGEGHLLSPSAVPYRANIYALKSLGVERIITVNAVGSFKKELKPGDLVIPDQIIDRTRHRAETFFGGGIVVHVPFADPFCPVLSRILYDAAKKTKATVHRNGTYLAMEGPAFSTRAESRLYRSWGADIIGMTAIPEAKLAREAEICYAMIAGVTDYDSWQEKSEVLVVGDIFNTLRQNVDAIKEIIRLAVAEVKEERDCECASALSVAIATSRKHIPAQLKKKLDLLLGKYLKGDS